MPTAVLGSVQRNTEQAQTQPATQANSSRQPEALASGDIAQLAYALWQERGCPEGSAEQDWLEAEQKLRELPTRTAPESRS